MDTNPYASLSELGKKSDYDPIYNPDRLFAISRSEKRQEIGVDPENIPFYGFDSWNHYEVSWLNEKGKPMVALAEIVYDCASEYLVESKSLKLYFNSFNNTIMNSVLSLENTIKKDLQAKLHTDVFVRILPLNRIQDPRIAQSFPGICLDDRDVACSVYTVEPAFLTVETEVIEEMLYSDLLKSNCLVTNQPDWGSVQICYKGNKINQDGLLKYLVSFRNHNEFHEQCIERIFMDIMRCCKPQSLTVYGRYTRRGGLDINPCRSTEKVGFEGTNVRLIRQ